jgi:hypothetical protein
MHTTYHGHQPTPYPNATEQPTSEELSLDAQSIMRVKKMCTICHHKPIIYSAFIAGLHAQLHEYEQAIIAIPETRCMCERCRYKHIHPRDSVSFLITFVVMFVAKFLMIWMGPPGAQLWVMALVVGALVLWKLAPVGSTWGATLDSFVIFA